MADAVKQKVTTPKGELIYVNISGLGKLDYDGKFYEYTAGIKLPKKKAKEFYEDICEFFDNNKPSWYKEDEPSNKIMREIEGSDDFMFQFKTKASFEDEKGNIRDTTIKIANRRNVEVNLPENEGIGNGSIGRISGTMTIHSDKRGGTAGVSLWLSNIQLLKYIKYVADLGFEEDEDGDFEDFGDTIDDFKEEKVVEEPKKKKKKKKKD